MSLINYQYLTTVFILSFLFLSQLVKYSLEKKVTEQKRQLQLQSSSRDGYLSQMNDLDEKFSAVLKQADFISEQMEKLEANGIYSGTSDN